MAGVMLEVSQVMRVPAGGGSPSYQVSRVLVSSWFSPLRRELPVAREMLR